MWNKKIVQAVRKNAFAKLIFQYILRNKPGDVQI